MTSAQRQEQHLNLYVHYFRMRGKCERISQIASIPAVFTCSIMLTVITAQATDGYQEITLAVLGASGVGKSTFIQHALDLRKPTNGPVSSSKVALSGITYRFQLLELELSDIDYTARQIKWPTYINSQLVPPIDGVVYLYDITNQESIAEVPELLRKSILFGLALLFSLHFDIHTFDGSPSSLLNLPYPS